MLTININTARHFILGKQGLWPGRRWRGIQGTEQAMRTMEYLQLDPLQIVARSQDIKLHSRVLDTTPGMWEDVACQQRKFFDWGGWLATRPISDAFHRDVPFSKAKQIREAMLADGDIIEVQVEGWKAVHYALSSDAEALRDLSTGGVPKAWTPLETTTTEEVVVLAPLDPVSARGRAKVLFGFDYVWEVYKPEHQRRFGYYTLPILWGDRLVARFDSKLDRTTNTFVILGLWLEDKALGKDEAFAEALARGFARFVTFLGASKLDAGILRMQAIGEPLLRRRACSSYEERSEK